MNLIITSPALTNGYPIPAIFSAEGENISPPLEWNRGPKNTRSYAIIMEDPDAPNNPPFVHWLVYNLPPEINSLPGGVPPHPELEHPRGARQGINSRGESGYFGPRPPVGDPAHHYHFQVFALDTRLDLPAGADRMQLLTAMSGHILSVGDLMGSYER